MFKPARFRTARRRRRWTWSRAKWAVLLALLLGLWLFRSERETQPEALEPVDLTFRLCGEAGSGPCVIDGDTLAIGQRRVRLTGFDTPEMDGACEAERFKAAQARDALLSWLDQGRFHWTGGAEPPRDRYGRELREARRGEDLLAEVMIGAGLAEGSGWGAERVEWC